MAYYRKTYEQRMRDKERRDDIKEILNFLKYNADDMDLPPEIRDLVKHRLQTSHRMEKSEQTILREKWKQYVDDQCHALLVSLVGHDFTPVCDIVTSLPFEMTPQQFGQRTFGEDPRYKMTKFRYHDRSYSVEREERRTAELISFEGKPLQIPCTRTYYRVTRGA